MQTQCIDDYFTYKSNNLLKQYIMRSENNTYSSSNNHFNSNQNLPNSTSHSLNLTSYSETNFSSNLILKNTQFLTNLQNYLTYSKAYVQAKIDYLYAAIDPGAICRLIVQNMYLLQISSIFKLKLWISQSLYVDKEKNAPNLQNTRIYQLFCFERQLQQYADSRIKSLMLKKKFTKLFDQGSGQLQTFFFILQKLIKTAQSYLQHFMQKQSKSQSSSGSVPQLNRSLLVEFVKIYHNLIKPQRIRFTDHKMLFKLLQHTKLFRYHSMVVKIVNNSLLYSFKLNSHLLINQLRTSLIEVAQYFQLQIQEELKYQRNVVKLIDQFFSNLCKLNVIEITKSLKGVHNQDQNKSKEFLSLFEYDQQTEYQFPTITATILIPQQKSFSITPQLLQAILNNQPLPNFQLQKESPSQKNLQFEISYTYVTNEIKVKCITDIDVLVDNLDFLNYIMTTFNDELKSAISVDTIQKFRRSMTKRIEKVICFKLNAKLKPNQEPLSKMLQLIDIGVLTSKIFSSELSKKNYVKPQQYQKRQQICEIFRHYDHIFRKIIRKFYSEIQKEISN